MGKDLFLRVNGRGNAWPLPLGQEHPFYKKGPQTDYANASFSLLWYDDTKQVSKDILVDAGHGIIPFLLHQGNRIPDAMVITHPHFDHILGMDWIIQSHYRFRGHQPYPVYATRGCRQQILQTLPHLEGLADFHEVRYGRPTPVRESEGLTVTAFPVFHGAHARGASMLLFRWEREKHRVLFTGDLLFPMIRKKDISILRDADWLIVDANNRFPYPGSNHWSVTRNKPEDDSFLSPWMQQLKLPEILRPHQQQGYEEYEYLLEWASDFPAPESYLLNVVEFVRAVMPRNVMFTHYSGLEDQKYYNQPLCDTQQLGQWGKHLFDALSLSATLHIPDTGDIFAVA